MNDDKPYFSLLICDRPGKIEVYSNGLKIGDINDGTFVPDKLCDRRNPFDSLDALAAYLRQVASDIGCTNVRGA